MRIQGDLATYEFSDLLQWLAQGCKTGVLTVSDGDVEYQLGFDRGRIDMSSSTDPDKRLDSYLYRKGLIDKATLDRGERLREATQMKSGQVLVTLGAVSELQLAKTLRDRTEEILCELLAWDRGSFEFAGGKRPEASMVPISLEVTKLLLESMHRLDQRGKAEQPDPPAAVPEMPEMPAAASLAPDATQAIEGLALAEVLDPESSPAAAPAFGPAEAAGPSADPAADLPGEDLLPAYAVMARAPGAVRRLAPYVLVVALSLLAGGFHLANIEASARAEDGGTAGEPILFSRTLGPPRPAPAERAAFFEAEAPVQAMDRTDTEEALRRRYEEELASLRQELEEARRLARPAPDQRAVQGSVQGPMQVSVQGAGPAAGEPDRVAVVAELSAESPARATADGTALPANSTRRPGAPSSQEPAGPLGAGSPVPSRALEPEPAAAKAAPQPAGMPVAEDGISEVEVVNPTLLNRPAPRYPLAAQRHKRGATVMLRVLVGTDGRVEEVARIGPKAGMGFDRAAEEAALASTWEPGTRNGEPAATWAALRFEFKP